MKSMLSTSEENFPTGNLYNVLLMLGHFGRGVI